jgi:hypothetical protein
MTALHRERSIHTSSASASFFDAGDADPERIEEVTPLVMARGRRQATVHASRHAKNATVRSISQ